MKVGWFDKDKTVLENYQSIGLVLKDGQKKVKQVDEVKRDLVIQDYYEKTQLVKGHVEVKTHFTESEVLDKMIQKYKDDFESM